jgi:predicted dehydrogenase/threonine dehydrogenase-like Zn-dependent dehydrogenase
MKAVVQNMKTGELRVDDVPPPTLKRHGILVAVTRSLISLGTERAIIELAHKGPIGKAKDRPDLARKVINKAKQEGLWNTYKVVKNLLDSPIPLGYSCAGVVLAAGAEAGEFKVGDRVACAGLNFANHAEIDYVPKNLAQKIPDGLGDDAASFVTVGAIAMQGVRLAKLTLGETVVVMGLGLVGQIAVQLARASGATVIATDLDPAKVALAKRLGAHAGAAGLQALRQGVLEMTSGLGADAVLVCAATKSSAPMQLAAEISRLKGRVVLVGDVGMRLERRAWYDKELEIVVSRSYGPGRYDAAYEQRGQDYPLPYVRWTERRNMQSFLELCAQGAVDVAPLISHRFGVERAEEAYEIVTGKRREPAIAIVLEYPGAPARRARVDLVSAARPAASGPLKLGVIGAGQFAKAVLLPAFKAQRQVAIEAVCTSSGLTSKSVAERYKAAFCTSEAQDVIESKNVDAVLIATRHDQHAPLVLAALRARKAIFVEKPVAIDEAQLAELEAEIGDAAPQILVGFNRRFSPLAAELKSHFAPRSGPIFAAYRVNAGALAADSWAHDPVEGAGRIIGEICHMVDFLAYLTGSVPVRVFAESLDARGDRESDNLTITIRFADSSVGTIHYLANGDPSMPKEYVEVFGGERSAVLDNYKTLTLHGRNRAKRRRLFNQAKGHTDEVAAFVKALTSGGPWPMDWKTVVAVTKATFAIRRSLRSGVPEAVDAGEAPADSASTHALPANHGHA